MANIKSQIKRIKQSEVAGKRNTAYKSGLKTDIKKFSQALEAKKKDGAATLLAKTIKSLDKASSKGIIAKNQAARKKSSLTVKLNKMK
ncbi:MAG: 30S ribosomal protein S20 [Actinobacteria bacterium]|nr:MAG: 30S ribosomal protein S20 [Actinomycetota bacterium]